MLILLDASKAETFGLPTANATEQEIIAEYTAKGWTEDQIKNHIECAINAGAYVRKGEKEWD